MAIRIELSLRLQNTPGALARICKVLSDEHVNLLALNVESGGMLRMVVDNHVHAAGSLRDCQYAVEQRDVLYIQMPNGPGVLETVARLLADAGVNLEYVYGSALEEHTMAAIVVGVPDAQRASMAAGV